MNELPLGLRHAIESGNCVLFIGAGIGAHLSDRDGNQAPDGISLAKELAEYFSIDTGGVFDLAKVSEIIEIRKGRKELEVFLKKRLSNLEPDENLRFLFSFRWKAIFTTNYDNGIERAYELIPEPQQKPITVTITPEIVPFDTQFEVPVYHLHGYLFGPSKSLIIITENDYPHFREKRRMLFGLLKNEFATSPILYIGYSNRDPNWKTILTEIKDEFFPSALPNSYRIAPHSNAIDVEILKARNNIETIDLSFEDFIKALKLSVPVQRDRDKMLTLRSEIPSDLITCFENNPVATLRLLGSWTYVNQAQFDEKPNIRDFLRGDRPNWGLIASRQHFERDLEEDIYEELLDFATGSQKTPNVSIILGPAGYGITTLMMTLAAKLVQDRAGSVFMVKPGSPLLEGDIEFAVSTAPNKPFIFVDDAADHSGVLLSINHRLKDMKIPAMFVLGERLNEWRQSRTRIRGKEFLLEPLSDPEIYRLLECLAKQSSLNMLEHLDKGLQFAAIKRNYRKELLVAMREATEGRSFDAIIEDEFRGIGGFFSKQLYLIVCCFYQHGAYIRDSLLAQLLNTSLTELYSLARDTTEGVVIFDCINQKKEIYAARARHRLIAAIVWERCGDAAEQENLIKKAISSLNLNYNIDKEAFEYFIRSDRIIDRIQTLEGKIQYFEMACRKDPESPYVRQHYARMLSRAEKQELALSQIDEALRLDSAVRVLHHTKGMILMQLALGIESPDIARKRFAQSEECFRRGLSLSQRDDYCYLGLAQLYFGWAKRAPSQEESVEYLSKAEDTISEGLGKVRVRDGLWIESSKIQAYIGDEPSRLSALEKAIQVNPGSIIGRYLLGRAYRKKGLYQKSIDVLETVILNHHEKFRVFVEYSVSLLYLKRTYKEAIAVLNMSSLYGLSDPRFIATLGGMLFLDGSFSEAQRVFNESPKHNFTATEMNEIQFQPPNPLDPSTPLRLSGKVKVVKAGYAMIESPGYPDFLCPGSKFGEIIMNQGLAITFEPAFSAKGAIVIHPQVM